MKRREATRAKMRSFGFTVDTASVARPNGERDFVSATEKENDIIPIFPSINITEVESRATVFEPAFKYRYGRKKAARLPGRLEQSYMVRFSGTDKDLPFRLAAWSYGCESELELLTRYLDDGTAHRGEPPKLDSFAFDADLFAADGRPDDHPFVITDLGIARSEVDHSGLRDAVGDADLVS